MGRPLNTIRGILFVGACVVIGVVLARRTLPKAAVSQPPAAVPASSSPAGASNELPSRLPPFTVVWKDRPPALAILVDPVITDEQLAALINGLRAARVTGALGRFLPATTPGAQGGSFETVQLFVMSDTAWATAARLTAFVYPTSTALSPAEDEFGRHIRAYYFYIAQGDHEVGSVGYDENGYKFGTAYQKLFQR